MKMSITIKIGQIDDPIELLPERVYGATPLQIKTVYNENSAVRFGPASGQP